MFALSPPQRIHVVTKIVSALDVSKNSQFFLVIVNDKLYMWCFCSNESAASSGSRWSAAAGALWSLRDDSNFFREIPWSTTGVRRSKPGDSAGAESCRVALRGTLLTLTIALFMYFNNFRLCMHRCLNVEDTCECGDRPADISNLSLLPCVKGMMVCSVWHPAIATIVRPGPLSPEIVNSYRAARRSGHDYCWTLHSSITVL